MKIRFENTLTSLDVHRHIPHIFTVPAGTTEILADFQYAPRFSYGQQFHNQMSLSIADPNGARGVYYLQRDYKIRISEAGCTPGFANGPIPPGLWQIDVDTYRLLPPDPITYSIEVTLNSHVVGTAPVFPRARPSRRGPGWFKGDLHAHSLHSDASWDIPDLVAYARARGHDFVSLTDHNTVSGLPQHESLGDDDFLTMGGLELTTYYGHAVALGASRWLEWRLDTKDKFTMPQLAQQVMDSGAFFITAHPNNPGDPECSGCHWDFADMMPGNSPAVEIWNGRWTKYNEMSVQLFYSWLNSGRRMVATGGTDLHGHPGHDPIRHGTNNVYAEELTQAGIIAALREGHSYLSAGPTLLFSGTAASGAKAISGDSLPVEDAAMAVAWRDAHPGDRLRFIVNGQVRDDRAVDTAGEASWPLARGEAGWCTVELRDAAGDMWAISNPIFLDGRPR